MPRAACDSSRSTSSDVVPWVQSSAAPRRRTAKTEVQARVFTTPRRPVQAELLSARLAEAEDELRVVGHLVRRPRRVPRELDLDVLDAGQLGRSAVDVLLDHRPSGTTHRSQAVRDLHLRACDADDLEEPENADVHPQPGILDAPHRLD